MPQADRRTDDEIRADLAQGLPEPCECGHQHVAVYRLAADVAPLLDRALAAEAEVAALRAENDKLRDGIPRQRKGLNPFLADAPVRKAFTDEGVLGSLGRWCDAEREKEAWRDGDTNTYRYRANLLEAVIVRFHAAEAELAAERARHETTREQCRCGAWEIANSDESPSPVAGQDQPKEPSETHKMPTPQADRRRRLLDEYEAEHGPVGGQEAGT